MNLTSTHVPASAPRDGSFGGEICDAHHHLVESTRLGHGQYLPSDLQQDVAGLPVTKSVVIECSEHYRPDGPVHLRPVGETEWTSEMSINGVVSGIVGYADLFSDKIGETLAAHIDAGRGKFRGVRRRTAWDPDPAISNDRVPCWPGMLTSPAFVRGAIAVGKAALVLDAFLYFHQLPEVVQLARLAPETTIVIDHLGGLLGVGSYAARRSEVTARWRADVSEAATCPNLLMKVGGFGRPLAGRRWETGSDPTPEELASVWSDDIAWVLERFGSKRCMFESNFPVDRACYSYATCWNAFAKVTSSWSSAERADLFHDTAVRVYSLGAVR